MSEENKRLNDLVLISKPLTDTTHGDFQETIEEDALYIREDAYNIVKQSNVRWAAEFYSIVSSFPTTFKEGLGWTLEEVYQAGDKLKETLRGHVDDKLLDWKQDSNLPAMGALPPSKDYIKEVPWKKGKN